MPENPKKLPITNNQLLFLLWLTILALSFAWRTQNLDAYGLSNDEGVYLMWGRLAADGYQLYSQTYAVQPPLFLEWVGWAFRLAGPSIEVGRWAILPSFGLLAVVLSWLAYRSGDWPAAITAVLLLGLSPLSFTFSRLVMAEIPATALAVLSVAVCFRWLDTGRQRWLFASGLALGLSFLLKALNPFVIVPIIWLIVVSPQDTRKGCGQWSVSTPKAGRAGTPGRGVVGGHVIRTTQYAPRNLQSPISNLFFWSLGLILPLAAVPLLYDLSAVYDQLLRFRGDLRAAIPGSTAETGSLFAAFISTHWGFWLLAFGGIMATVWQRRRGSEEPGSRGAELVHPSAFILPPSSFRLHPLTWLVWLIAGIAMLWWHTPLFPHHFVVLLPPLILLGARFISNWLLVIGNWRSGGGQRLAVMLYSLLMVIAAINIPAMVTANNDTAAIVTGGREAEALKLLQAVSAPGDFVMGDSQLLIFMANRRTPPPLGDVALVAIKAGRQTSARMITLTEQYQAPAVVQWSLRLPWLPEYLEWVEQNYLARRVWDNDHIIHFGLRLPPGQPLPNERTVRLGDSLALRGYNLEADAAKPGQPVTLKVYWQTDVPLQRDYTVFTQLLNQNGALIASWDSQPFGAYFPTSQWPANEIVTDIVQLPIPAETPPGDYTLITGMYLLDTLERLRTAEGSDYITLTTLRLE